MATSQMRAIGAFARSVRMSQRAFTTSARQFQAAPTLKTPTEKAPVEVEEATTVEVAQAPNRQGIWTRSQRPRSKAMSGPRFEQTDFSVQPQPQAAIELIHQQPVRWTHDRMVVCDGGGGPAGHPKIYINTDKAEIANCSYCGIPYANEHHRKHLESLPETSYPLS